ncbi:MAG: NifU family protein [Flavobacteriia bacterium]|nr:NifU family protein [Flavobacteriia bacterium]OJX39834.1 MAG: hypothetical protein BGO87_02425 [Flavobacteriia bacterium 40-80]
MHNREELLARIESSLEAIRPHLEADGGNVEVVDFTDEHIVKIRLLGACSDCSMSLMTIRAGIEEAIKRVVPEVAGVEPVTDIF